MHGVGGIVGALLTGCFAYGPLSATTASPEGCRSARAVHHAVLRGGGGVRLQAVATWILLKIVDVIVGLRVTEEEEREGLDVVAARRTAGLIAATLG